jgi:hypothetical protein
MVRFELEVRVYFLAYSRCIFLCKKMLPFRITFERMLFIYKPARTKQLSEIFAEPNFDFKTFREEKKSRQCQFQGSGRFYVGGRAAFF